MQFIPLSETLRIFKSVIAKSYFHRQAMEFTLSSHLKMKQTSNGYMFAIALTFGFGLVYLSCGDHAVLTCDRTQNQCQLVKKNFWRSLSQDFPIQDLQKSEEIFPGGEALPYVKIYTSRGEIDLESWSNFSINEIQAFVNEPTQKLLNIKTYPWSSWWSGAIYIGLSFWGCLISRIHEVKK